MNVGTKLAALVCLVAGVGVSPLHGQIDPQGYQNSFSEAVGFLQSEKFAEAQAILERLRDQGHRSATLLSTLGLAYQGQGRHSEAIDQFRQSLALDPAQPETRTVLGTSLLLSNRSSEAIPELETAAAALSSDLTVQELLARAYLESGRLLDAATCYQRLASARPEDPEIAFHLGRLYLDLAEWSSNRLLEQGDESARVHQAAGQASLLKGDLEAAGRSFIQAIELAPEMPDLHLALAGVYLREGKLAEALAEVEAELKIIPWNLGAKQLKSQLEKDLAGQQ